MTDLSSMPQAVREAMEYMDANIGEGSYRKCLNVFRTELLRLTAENAELRTVCEEAELNREGIKHAHAELLRVKAERDALRDNRFALEREVENLHREIDALDL